MKKILIIFSFLSAAAFTLSASAKELTGHCDFHKNSPDNKTISVPLKFYNHPEQTYGWVIIGQDIGPFKISVILDKAMHPDQFGLYKNDRLRVHIYSSKKNQDIIVPTKAFVSGEFVEVYWGSSRNDPEWAICSIGVK